MQPIRTYLRDCPDEPIPVEFVVLHYTAESLDDTLAIFGASNPKAGAHLVVAPEGEIHEITRCWDGTALRAAHAGVSRWSDGGRTWDKFNDHSIGIEIVNYNGNVLAYTDRQYDSLVGVLKHLKAKYPALSKPERILGHEQVAGWRGKVDPGAKFDWKRIFERVYPGVAAPDRSPACPPDLVEALAAFADAEPSSRPEIARYWRAINYFLEKAVAHLRAMER